MIRLYPNGTIEFDTLAELLSYDRVRGNIQVDPSDAWSHLRSLLGHGNKLSLLSALKEASGGISVRELASILGRSPNWVTGVLNGGILRNIKQAHLMPSSIYLYDSDHKLYPGPLLKEKDLFSDPAKKVGG